MSHRYNTKNDKTTNGKKKTQVIVENLTPIEHDQLEETILTILDRSDENFTCPRCYHKEHGYLDMPGDGSALICQQCGEVVPVLIPIYQGRGHDNVMGYQIVELGKQPRDTKIHLVGQFPDDFIKSFA